MVVVDLKQKAEVVNYDRHGFNRPNLWHRPVAKVATIHLTNRLLEPLLPTAFICHFQVQ